MLGLQDLLGFRKRAIRLQADHVAGKAALAELLRFPGHFFRAVARRNAAPETQSPPWGQTTAAAEEVVALNHIERRLAGKDQHLDAAGGDDEFHRLRDG